MLISPNYFDQKHIYTDRGQRMEQKTDTAPNQSGNGGNIKLLYVHEDIMGNTRYHTKDNGQAHAELEYDIWGAPTSPSKLENNDNGTFIFAQFTGHIYDTVLDIYFAEARFYDAKNRQWLSSDPMKDGLNWYQYVRANPATFIDSSGLVPNALEAAEMADDIYKAAFPKDGSTPIPLSGGWTLIEIKTSILSYGGYGYSNLKMGVYERENNDGTVEYAVVNKGTTVYSQQDWLNNISQPMGLSSDARESMSYAKEYDARYKNEDLTFIGHSKGGAEAIINAVATGRPAITFNPMAPGLNRYGLNGKDYTGIMTNYVVKDEILNILFGEPSVGETIYLDTQHKTHWILWLSIFHTGNNISNHLMTAVKAALIEYFDRMACPNQG